MNTSRRTLLGASGGLAALLSGLAPSTARAEAQEVSIAVSSTSFVLGGVRIGLHAGLFAKNGLAPRIIVMNSGSAAMAALIGGSVPFAVSGPSEALAARLRKQDVVIAGNLYAGLAGSVVLSKKAMAGLKATAQSPLDQRLRALDGLLIAVPSATSALLGPVRTAAEQLGVHPRFTYMAQGAMPAALANDAIQGMSASFPFAGIPILQGTGALWIDGPGGELPADVLPSSSSTIQCTAAYASAHPEVIAALRKSLADIAAFVTNDQPAAKAALAAGYSELSPEAIDLSFAQQWRNWTKPMLTAADMRQELKLLEASSKLPGLDTLDPTTALLPPS
jgi:ABC-type nitrate/sulfonate/bicarbonate transport system substrate-binding protein